MTTELTKAAQQATKQAPVLSDGEVRHYATCCVTTEDAIRAAEQKVLERALTQRPAAQTEREAFEARVVAEAGEGAIAKWLGTDGYENTRVQDNRLGWVWCLEWQARASLTAPQQATPEPCKSFSQLYERNRAGVDAELAAMASEATPEPVGEVANFIVSAIVIKETVTGFNTQNKLYAVAATSREEAHGKALPLIAADFPEHMLHTICSHEVTRPAPGVPDVEDLRDRLVAISAAVADCDDRAAQSMLGEIMRLLAAQAKGGE